jgi:hypothetical protein
VRPPRLVTTLVLGLMLGALLAAAPAVVAVGR